MLTRSSCPRDSPWSPVSHHRAVSDLVAPGEEIRMLLVNHLQIIPAAPLHLAALLLKQHGAAQLIKHHGVHLGSSSPRPLKSPVCARVSCVKGV